MSSKRIFGASVSYAELFRRCPKNQIDKLLAVQTKHKAYLDRLNSLPEELQSINWDYYKSNVRPEFLPMVEEFEKKYTTFQVPYPENPYSAQIDKLAEQAIDEICMYKAESDKRIQEYERKYCSIISQIPFEEMSMEEFIDAYPNDAPDFINRPTFWPHTPEEQILPDKMNVAETQTEKTQTRETVTKSSDERQKKGVNEKDVSTSAVMKENESGQEKGNTESKSKDT